MVHNSEDVPSFNLEILQKAYIEIDEKGMEAAAITCLHAVPGYCPMPKRKTYDFVANHPFVFMISEESSDLVFFTGAVLNPIQEN
ncbi:hypothetical protein Vadar_031546 [Vaccinium darrowii]|uniref:Uncharacterized protein n=1 Tax=Vaccinium darrowii TaxID=229202 RepID=A0ACB7YBM6_9ERIC|nr:hypothetical protein Vadar_031546 [Vaccinium darrowii]